MLLFFNSSKTQSFAGPTLSKSSQPQLLDKTRQLLELLRPMPADELGKLLGTSEKLTRQSWQQYQEIHLPLTPRSSRQALAAFTGDAYRAIVVEEYDEASQVAEDRVVGPSGAESDQGMLEQFSGNSPDHSRHLYHVLVVLLLIIIYRLLQ